MLMTAVHRMDSSSAAAASPPPWLPFLAVPSHHHHQHLLNDFTATPACSASSTATAPPPALTPSNSTQHHHLLPRSGSGARRATRRRPRPSRRLPTTYISADPASFRRMVHQVTGADDPNIAGGQGQATLLRPAPVRADGGFTTGPGAVLPTLDTSAGFLVAAHAPSSRTDDTCAAPAPAVEVEVGVGRACNGNSAAGGGGGGFFPTLESSSSWDQRALF